MNHRKLHPLSDRIGRQKVESVVAAFYERLREDTLIAPLFSSVDDFARHELRVTDFWWIAMGGQPPARETSVDMLGVHAPLGLGPVHFDRWLEHLSAVLDEQLEPSLATAWKQMAEGIAARLMVALSSGSVNKPGTA